MKNKLQFFSGSVESPDEPDPRTVLNLWLIGHTAQQIADQLGVTVQAVDSCLAELVAGQD